MFPLYDTVRTRSFPFTNVLIITVNVVMFFVEITQGTNIDRFLLLYGVVPIRYSNPLVAEHFTFFEQVLPFISSMFLHGGWLHLIFNMWFLWIFGDAVEDRMGHLRYFFFYLVCGIIAMLMQVLFNFRADKPAIGASGAIAGVMGAYFILYPLARVIVLVPIFLLPFFFTLPAFFFLGFWLFMQFYGGYASLIDIGGQFAGIAWWAHIGGFTSGMILVFVFRKSKKNYRPFYADEISPW